MTARILEVGHFSAGELLIYSFLPVCVPSIEHREAGLVSLRSAFVTPFNE
jgi:hypothetical protein